MINRFLKKINPDVILRDGDENHIHPSSTATITETKSYKSFELYNFRELKIFVVDVSALISMAMEISTPEIITRFPDLLEMVTNASLNYI